MPARSLRFAALAAFVTCAAAQNANTIVQMFGWNWDSIATECTQYLGPNGYGYVQISPPQETITGDQWWTDYQPVSYILQGKRGDRDSLSAMISTCNAAGVKVLADAVINHMTGNTGSGTGTAGTAYSHFEYGSVYSDSNGAFHHCGLTPDNDIEDYTNRVEVQTCQLDGLADLATDNAAVQATIAGYMNDLMSLGVAGFRIDASKHIAATNISAILSQVTTAPTYVTQEIIFGEGEPIQPTEYIGNGNVQEFRYTSTLQSAFLSGGISTLTSQIPGDGWLNSSDANVFVANHDTERNGDSLSYNSTSNTYTLAHVFMFAYPYGHPTVLSGYSFTSYDDGAPKNGIGSCYGDGGVNGWLCQHRWDAIIGMNAFYAAVSGDIGNVMTGSQQQLAFSRGSTGFVAINNDDSTWSGTFATGLPAGTYCNAYEGARNDTGCAGSTITVGDDASASLTINAREAVAFYVGGEAGESEPASTTASSSSSTETSSSESSTESSPSGDASSSPTVSSTASTESSSVSISTSPETEVPGSTESSASPSSTQASSSAESSQSTGSGATTFFNVDKTTKVGDIVMVVGSINALGNWDPSKAIALSTDSLKYPTWSANVSLSSDADYEFKYIIKTADGTIEWEADPNRPAKTTSAIQTWQT